MVDNHHHVYYISRRVSNRACLWYLLMTYSHLQDVRVGRTYIRSHLHRTRSTCLCRDSKPRHDNVSSRLRCRSSAVGTWVRAPWEKVHFSFRGWRLCYLQYWPSSRAEHWHAPRHEIFLWSLRMCTNNQRRRNHRRHLGPCRRRLRVGHFLLLRFHRTRTRTHHRWIVGLTILVSHCLRVDTWI